MKKTKYFLTLLLVSLMVMPAFAADKNPAAITVNPQILSQIDEGWYLKELIKGDLNKDGLEDFVTLVGEYVDSNHFVFQIAMPDEPPYMNSLVEENWDTQSENRQFMVFFAQQDGSFKHVFSNGDWVGRADFGGTLGDSHDAFYIDRGSIVIGTYGGGFTRWAITARIRYQENKWRLIGYTSFYLNQIDIDWQKYDRNLLTNKIKITIAKNDEIVKDYWDEIGDKTKIYLPDARPQAMIEK